MSLVGNTCEKYARDRLNDFYMIRSFYEDKDLTIPLFGEDEFDELENQDIKKIVFDITISFKALMKKIYNILY